MHAGFLDRGIDILGCMSAENLGCFVDIDNIAPMLEAKTRYSIITKHERDTRSPHSSGRPRPCRQVNPREERERRVGIGWC
jgi:hypothetical protein